MPFVHEGLIRSTRFLPLLSHDAHTYLIVTVRWSSRLGCCIRHIGSQEDLLHIHRSLRASVHVHAHTHHLCGGAGQQRPPVRLHRQRGGLYFLHGRDLRHPSRLRVRLVRSQEHRPHARCHDGLLGCRGSARSCHAPAAAQDV
jgi:hypothetical protein